MYVNRSSDVASCDPSRVGAHTLLWSVSLLTRQLLHKWKISSPAVRVLGMSLLTPSCQWNLVSSGTAAVQRISHADAELVWPNHAASCLWKCTGEGVLGRSAVCCSPWPCGLKSARFLCPWDFFCKNNGVGYHFPPPGESFGHGDQTRVSCVSFIVWGFFTHWARRKAHRWG